MNSKLFSIIVFILIFTMTACTLPTAPGPVSPPQEVSPTPSNTLPPAPPTETFTPPPTDTPIPTDTATPLPTETPTQTPLPVVESLKATVTADLLSCRYGPGAYYLFLYGLRKGANIKLIGRTDANNWVYVDGKNKCWVNTNYLEIQGDPMSLEIVYPGKAKLPVSPYYSPTDWVGATRTGNKVEVEWNDVPLRAGDEENERMQHYIIEVWRCESGQIIFEPLATNDLAVIFIDEPGCNQQSHGRVFVQEKHGYAGPSEIPWPPHETP